MILPFTQFAPSCSRSQLGSHPWLLSLPHSIYIITKSCQLCFQNTWWTDTFSPLLQLPPHATAISQATAAASYAPALLHLHSFFSIQRPQWSFKNQLGLRTLQRFPKDKISDPSVDPTRPDPCPLVPTHLPLPPLTIPSICTGCLLAFPGTHQICSHLMVFALISSAWNVLSLDTCMTCPLLHLGSAQLFSPESSSLVILCKVAPLGRWRDKLGVRD